MGKLERVRSISILTLPSEIALMKFVWVGTS